MLRIFYHEEAGDDVESNMIAEASNRLDVGEFQLFELGYEHWFGQPAPADRIETDFFAYLAHNEPPPWARHYARHIIALDEEGMLQSGDETFHRFDRDLDSPSRWYGWTVVGATLAVVAAFLGLLILGDASRFTAQCMFPPCP